jgi:hypothetical protein
MKETDWIACLWITDNSKSVWTGYLWLRTGPEAGTNKHGDETSDSIHLSGRGDFFLRAECLLSL